MAVNFSPRRSKRCWDITTLGNPRLGKDLRTCLPRSPSTANKALSQPVSLSLFRRSVVMCAWCMQAVYAGRDGVYSQAAISIIFGQAIPETPQAPSVSLWGPCPFGWTSSYRLFLFIFCGTGSYGRPPSVISTCLILYIKYKTTEGQSCDLCCPLLLTDTNANTHARARARTHARTLSESLSLSSHPPTAYVLWFISASLSPYGDVFATSGGARYILSYRKVKGRHSAEWKRASSTSTDTAMKRQPPSTKVVCLKPKVLQILS